MGILNAFDQWISSRYENHVSKMESQERCPDCLGKGFHTYPWASEFFLHENSHQCTGCNGSGHYYDWSSQMSE